MISLSSSPRIVVEHVPSKKPQPLRKPAQHDIGDEFHKLKKLLATEVT